MSRAYWSGSAETLIQGDAVAVLGQLVKASTFEVTTAQRDAWVSEIRQLQALACHIDRAEIYLEFAIPRMGRRADVVILWRGVVFVIEYKVGAPSFTQSALDQVLGYALDLKNFHETSHLLRVVPVLVATEAAASAFQVSWYTDQVATPVRTTPPALPMLLTAFTEGAAVTIDPLTWEAGRYRPTPTIIEAAQALYRNHSVEEISRNEAGAENLSTTASYIGRVIDDAKERGRKAICLVTGVPGSGKTLAGLNVATQRMQGHDDEHAVFLSGNGPLVDVLREALAQDALDVAKQAGRRSSHAVEIGRASVFIQNIHHFRDEALNSKGPMVGKVVVFDEAQRAWNVAQTSKFMREKRNQVGFNQSEPDFLLSVMNRNPDWCVVIGLVGGGQEINTGEAGLEEWLQALSSSYSKWDVHLSREALGTEYLPVGTAESLGACQRATLAPALHLSVSIRSFRAEKLSQFIAAVIDSDAAAARTLLVDLSEYPVVLTRSLSLARDWLRKHRRGDERAGLLASSNGLRLKPDGVFVRAKIDPAVWFLAPRGDVRSCDALEDAGTEFDVQGLELDWACVCWDANLRRSADGWSTQRFSGSRWQQVKDPNRRTFLSNSYRVLLTRARQGMVIFVPRGATCDETREPHVYDEIASFLCDCGIRTIEG